MMDVGRCRHGLIQVDPIRDDERRAVKMKRKSHTNVADTLTHRQVPVQNTLTSTASTNGLIWNIAKIMLSFRPWRGNSRVPQTPTAMDKLPLPS